MTSMWPGRPGARPSRLPRPNRLRRGRAALLSTVAALAVVLTACGGGSSGANPASGGGGSGASAGGGSSSSAALSTLNLANGPSGGPFQRNFNPVSGVGASPGLNMVYEPLLVWNEVPSAATHVTPWLAHGYRWSSNDKTLTFDLRKGVKWSDGTPFTSADVVFTFDLLKRFPALNTNAITFQSVTAPSPDQVKFTFSTPSFGQFFVLGSQPILPKAIWSKVKNPVNYANTKPVGTGPYLLQSWTPQYVTYTRNPHYWGGTPGVKELRYPSFDTSTTCGLYLETDKLQAANCQIFAYKKLFVDKDPAHNKVWFPPAGDEGLVPNLQVYPFNVLALRQAISLVINRQILSKDGESGLQPAVTTPTGALGGNRYIAPSLQHLKFHRNVAQARSLLKKAGFTFNSSGSLISPRGKPVKFTIMNYTSFADFMSDGSIILQELKSIGIHASQHGVSPGQFFSNLDTGRFQIAFSWTLQPIAPSEFANYYIYNYLLNTKSLKPVGKASTGDPERWTDPKTDGYLNDYLRATTDAQRSKAIDSLEKVVAQQLPMIPLLNNVWDCLYSTKHFVGWPSPSNPYQTADVLGAPGEQVILHLHPRT